MQEQALAPIAQTVDVTYRYPVVFTTNVFAVGNPILRDLCGRAETGEPSKILVVLDRGIAAAFPTLVDDITAYCAHDPSITALVRPPLLVEGGEAVKNDHATVEVIQRAINDAGIDRHNYVVVIGGGAVLDMAGFAAATAHRGVRLIRIPTTVLSQNDSGVGVKNGVNQFGKKNFLGTFAPPFAVIDDFAFLRGLPQREWLGGISEAIKVALLKDPVFFDFIEEHAQVLVDRDEDAMRWLIYRCAQLHLNHIATSGDPFEMGSSRPLDFGHWSAHKLEQLSHYCWRHGEAVAIGLSVDVTYSELTGLISDADRNRVIDLFRRLGLPTYAQELSEGLGQADDSRNILRGLNEFREHLGGRLTIMLLHGIGEGFEVNEIDEAMMIHSIAVLREEAAEYARREQHNGNDHAGQRAVPAVATATD